MRLCPAVALVASLLICSAIAFAQPCEPNCTGKTCGSDGCGGSCGKCQEGKFCEGGQCVVNEGCYDTPFPGCPGCICEECVCQMDSYCCQTAWDSLCVSECKQQCGGCGILASCGNGKCEPELKETCKNCKADCTCPPGQVCGTGGKCCTPSCAGKKCGDDGCGGSCGQCGCGEECVDFACEFTACEGRECGEDPYGCNVVCGDCAPEETCTWAGQCCVASCAGKKCGDDGCGGSCGSCQQGQVCSQGQCIVNDGCVASGEPGCNGCKCETCVCQKSQWCCWWQWDASCVQLCQTSCGGCGGMPSCNNKLCEPAAGENCVTCPADCGCPAGQTCINGTCCQPQCAGKQCGGDGCGGSCGTCQAGFVCQGGACLPTGQPCGQVTSYGCCSGETLQWCNNGVLASLNCAQNPKCGWDPFAGYYDCATAGGQDPSGAHPKACPGPCVPACVGFECGDDGCGGICGECADGETCENGVCVGACVPQCAGKECGNDGCGGSCGLCDPGCSCVNGKCQGCECIPDCAGKECGDDACGGSCGECPPGWSCQFWKCVPCLPDCAGKECGDNGCGGSCGICPDGCPCENGQCVGCTCWPNCAGKQCGFDGCGGSCGECDAGYVCNPQWQCVEQTCLPSCVGKECGDDACGGSCGVCLNYCPTPEHPDVPYPDSSLCMIDHHCVQACCPQCGGKECGDDGCGGVCGVCQGANEVCLAFKCICQPDCDGKECGPDGCGGSCGTCDGKEECVNGGCRGGGVDAGGEVETSGDAVAADAEEIPVDVGTEIQLKGPGSGGCDTGRQSAGALPAALLLVLLLTALPLVLRRTR